MNNWAGSYEGGKPLQEHNDPALARPEITDDDQREAERQAGECFDRRGMVPACYAGFDPCYSVAEWFAENFDGAEITEAVFAATGERGLVALQDYMAEMRKFFVDMFWERYL